MNKYAAFRNILFLGLLIANLVVMIQVKSQVKELHEFFMPQEAEVPAYIIMEPVPNV